MRARLYSIEQDFDMEEVYIAKFFDDDTESNVIIPFDGTEIKALKVGDYYKINIEKEQ